MDSRLPQYPALGPAIGATAGIVLLAQAGWAMAIPAVLAAATAIVLAAYRHRNASLILLAMVAGWAAAMLSAPAQPPQLALDDPDTHAAALVTDVSAGESAISFVARIDSVNGSAVAPFKAQLYMSPGSRHPVTGDRISFTSQLHSPACYCDAPFEPSTRWYHQGQGVTATGYVNDDNIRITGHETTLAASLARYRLSLLSRLAHSGISDESFAMLAALITGYDDEVSADTRESFRAAGVAHALALSGFHVGIIVIMCSIALYPLRFFTRLRQLRLALTILMTWGFVALAGWPVSAVRAAVMVSCYLLALIINRQAFPFNSLCMAWLCIVLISPARVYSPGLQLSTAAVAGIVALAGPLNPVNPRRRILYNTVAAFTVPVAAMLGTLPLTLLYFHSLPLLFIISNIFIAVTMPLWMGGGIILLISSHLGLATEWLAGLIDLLTACINTIIQFIAALPAASLDGIYINILQCTAIAAIVPAIVIIARYPGRRSAHSFAIVSAIAICVIAMGGTEPAKAGVFMSRQQSTTTLIVHEGRHAALIYSSSTSGHGGVVRSVTPRLEGFMTTHGIDSIDFGLNEFTMAGCSFMSDTLHTPSYTVAIARRTPRDTLTNHVDYLIIGNHFRGNYRRLLARTPCDTILIGVEANRKRRLAVIAAADTAGIPVIDLRYHIPHPFVYRNR